jgi:hypothetical protein
LVSVRALPVVVYKQEDMTMTKRHWAAAAVVVGLVAGGLTANTAWSSPRQNLLTFSGAVSLPGVILPAGTYVFEVVSSSGDVVRVSSKRGRHYFMGFTQRIERPLGRRDVPLATFGESPAGMPPTIAAWYPIGSSLGHRFIYPGSR